MFQYSHTKGACATVDVKEVFTQTDEDAVLNGPDSASSAPKIALFGLESHGVLDTGANADMRSWKHARHFR